LLSVTKTSADLIDLRLFFEIPARRFSGVPTEDQPAVT
jgi:hypothetical protein